MRARYSREELEALRYANVEPPEGADLSAIDESESALAAAPAGSSKSSRKRKRNKARNPKPSKHPRIPPPDEVEDEDGDFGGMFDEGDIFQNVFADPNPAAAAGTETAEELRISPATGGYYANYDESESEDDGPMQRVAFVVEGEPDFDKEEPDDGWEYIRRVKWEAARCPGLKVATISPEKLVNNQTCYVPLVPEIPTCEPHLLPTQDWEYRFLQTFSNLRSKFGQWEPPEPLPKPIPGLKDDSGWKSLCFGKPDDESSAAAGVSVAEEMEEFGAGPLNFYRGELTTLLNLDEVNRAFLLRRQVSWIKDMDHLPRSRALWLFALTAAVDEPVDADTSFALRSLLRSCAGIRAAGKYENDCELQLLNMIITVAGKYFGQDDSNRS